MGGEIKSSFCFDGIKPNFFGQGGFIFKTDTISFTERETECLIYFILGMTAKQSGNAIILSSKTIGNHVANIKSKLNCNNRYQIIIKALINGFQIQALLKKMRVFQKTL